VAELTEVWRISLYNRGRGGEKEEGEGVRQVENHDVGGEYNEKAEIKERKMVGGCINNKATTTGERRPKNRQSWVGKRWGSKKCAQPEHQMLDHGCSLKKE